MSDRFSNTKYGISTLDRIFSFTSIQGVIGAGKSTFIKRLLYNILASGQCAKTCTDFTHKDYYLFIDEPVDEWTSVKVSLRFFGQEAEPLEDQKSLLDTFYSDKSRWALMFQQYAFASRLRRVVDEIKQINPLIPSSARIHIISERSLRTDYLFFRNLYESRHVYDAEWLAYETIFNLVCTDLVDREDRMIFIDTDPRTCFERIKKRDRHAETTHCTTPEQDSEFQAYLVSLDTHHRRMIDQFKEAKGEDSVYLIDGNMVIASEEEYDAIAAHFRLVHSGVATTA